MVDVSPRGVTWPSLMLLPACVVTAGDSTGDLTLALLVVLATVPLLGRLTSLDSARFEKKRRPTPGISWAGSQTTEKP